MKESSRETPVLKENLSVVQWLYLEPSLSVRTFPPFKGPNKNPGGSTAIPFIFQWLYLEPARRVLTRTFLYSKGAAESSPSMLYPDHFSFQGLYLETTKGFQLRTLSYVSARAHPGGSTEIILHSKGFIRNPPWDSTTELFYSPRVVLRTHWGGSTENHFIFQGFYLEPNTGVLLPISLYSNIFYLGPVQGILLKTPL